MGAPSDGGALRGRRSCLGSTDAPLEACKGLVEPSGRKAWPWRLRRHSLKHPSTLESGIL